MPLIPSFEIGIWNAWILAAFLLLFIILSGILPRDIGKRISPAKEIGKINKLLRIVFFTMIIYSIFVPLKLGTAWLYAGLAVYLLGFVISTAALLSIATTKPGEVFTTGMYRYSRHPIALGTVLTMVGIGIVSASWLLLLLSVILIVISHYVAITEEIATTKKFGGTYSKYLKRTPRWLGIPKSVKK